MHKVRVLQHAVLVLALGLMGALAAPAAAADVDEVLDKLEKRFEALNSVHYVQKGKTTYPTHKQETTSKSWWKRDGRNWKMRRETSRKSVGKDQKQTEEDSTIVVFDGQNTWTEMSMEGRDMVFKAKTSRQSEFDDIRAQVKRGKAAIKGEESVDGRKCIVIEVAARDQRQKARYTYWLSDEYGIPLKAVTRSNDGTESEIVVTELEANKPIADSQFNYSAPEGAVVLNVDEAPQKP